MTVGWPEADWLYYRVYVDSYRRTQVVVDEVLRPLLDELSATPEAGQWFFLRYLDLSGLHVRLRFHGTEDRLSVLEDRIDASLRGLFDGGVLSKAAVNGNRIAGGAGAQERRGFVKAIYEPEHLKWGGEAGLAFAHRCFASSSRFAVESVDGRSWVTRSLVALVTMAASLTLLPDEARSSFAYQYVWYWCGARGGDPRSALAVVRKSAARTATRITTDALALLDDPRQTERLGRYVTALGEAVGEAAVAASGRTTSHLLFHHLHLTSNRLGINPPEEALLMETLRLCPELVSEVTGRVTPSGGRAGGPADGRGAGERDHGTKGTHNAKQTAGG